MLKYILHIFLDGYKAAKELDRRDNVIFVWNKY